MLTAMIHTLGLSPSLDVVHLCAGITAGQIHRPYAVRRLAGGKSLNAARAFARLGHAVRAVTPLGGPIGDLVAALLADSGVELARVATTAPTRMCLTAADTDARTQTEFYEPAAPPDGTEPAGLARLLAAVGAGEWLTVSGSVPAGIDLDALTALLRDCAGRGVRVAVDTHGPALAALVDARVATLVKVNRGEAEGLVGLGDPTTLAGAVQRRAGGATTVVITDGPAGAAGVMPGGRSVRVWTPAPTDGYPVGSGDCFLAGLVGGLERGTPFAAALVLGNAVGAANAQEPGAALFDLDTIERLRMVTRVS